MQERMRKLEDTVQLLEEKLLQLEDDQVKRRPPRIPTTVDLWSTIVLEGEVKYRDFPGLFTYPRGAPIPGTEPVVVSTKADTNIREGSSLPSGFSYVSTGLTCSLWGVRREVDALVPHLSFVMDFLQVHLDLAPLDSWNYMSSDEEGVQRWQLRASPPQVRKESSLFFGPRPSPWFIQSNQSFSLIASCGRVPLEFKHGVWLKLTLHGDYIPAF